jgi:CRISPR-associated endonuclease Cas1 subtype II
MSFRTIVINNRAKLDYELDYLVIKNENITKIPIQEISILIINNVQVSLTTYLVSKLVDSKVKVLFSDEKRNPCCEITPFYSNYSNYAKIKQQILWKQEIKDILWSKIIKKKLYYSNLLLNKVNKFSKEIDEYFLAVEPGDPTNREGHGAKVYFNLLFGNLFSRGADCEINKFLNYGYSIIVSAINREIKSSGYLTEIGIHHIGETNPFNLSYDFIEPLRALIDSYVVLDKVKEDDYKKTFQNILSVKVLFNGNGMYLENALHLYVHSLFNFLNEGKIPIFIEYEF